MGSWDTILNPEQMLLQVVEGLTECVENGCIERSRPGGHIDRIVPSFQGQHSIVVID